MSSNVKRNPILFPARAKDTNGHGANAFSFNSDPQGAFGEGLSAILTASLSNMSAFFEKASVQSNDHMKVSEDLFLAIQQGATQLGTKILENTLANTNQFLNATKSMSSAHRMEDLARLQSDAFQKYLSTSANQTKELFSLSQDIFQKVFTAFQIATTRAMESTFKFQ